MLPPLPEEKDECHEKVNRRQAARIQGCQASRRTASFYYAYNASDLAKGGVGESSSKRMSAQSGWITEVCIIFILLIFYAGDTVT